MEAISDVKRIFLPASLWEQIIEHCKRKIEGRYLPGETEMKRAYGLVAGLQEGTDFHVKRILPFKRNLRAHEPYKSYMDQIMEKYATPSKNPLSVRGWITDPQELKEYYEICDQEGLTVIGSYHMHTVAWAHDPLRDTPTGLDEVLARGSNLFTFIVSMVDINKPIIRAFFEGIKHKEIPIHTE